MASIDDAFAAPTPAAGTDVYSQMLQKSQDDAAQRAAMTVAASAQNDASQLASDVNLSSKVQATLNTVIPPEGMTPDTRQVLQGQLDQATVRRLAADNANTANFLSDPTNATLAYGDLPTVSFWSGLGNKLSAGTQEFGASYSLLTGLVQSQAMSDRALSFEDILGQEKGGLASSNPITAVGADASVLGRYVASRIGEIFDFSGKTDAQIAAAGQTATANVIKNYSQSVAQIEKDNPNSTDAQSVQRAIALMPQGTSAVDTLSNYLGIIRDNPVGFLKYAAESTTSMIPPLAITAAAGVATGGMEAGPLLSELALAGSMKTQAYGPAFETFAKNAGYDLSDPASVQRLASDPRTLARLKTSAGAYSTTMGLINAVGGGVAGKALTNHVLGDMIAQTLVQTAVGSGGEYLSRMAAGQPVDWNAVVMNGLMSMIATPATVGVMRGMGEGAYRVGSQIERSVQATARKSVFEAIADTSNNSELRAKVPTKYEDMVAAVTKDGPIENLHVSPEGMAEMFQSTKTTPEDFFHAIPELSKEDYLAAQAGGTDFQIPTSIYAAKIVGTKLEDALSQHIKFSPMEMSLAEATNLKADIAQHVDAIQTSVEDVQAKTAQMSAAGQAQYEGLVQSLTMAGRSPEVAAREALPLVQFAETRAARSGMPVEDFLQKYTIPGVYRVEPSTANAGVRSVALDPLVHAVLNPGAEVDPALRSDAVAVQRRAEDTATAMGLEAPTPDVIRQAAGDAARAGELSAPLSDEFYMAPDSAYPHAGPGARTLNEAAAPAARGLAPEGSPERVAAEQHLQNVLAADAWSKEHSEPNPSPLRLRDFDSLSSATFKRDGWFTFSTPDPGEARQRMMKAGLEYRDQRGFYEGKDDGQSFIVLGSHDLGEAFGRLYQQESILDNRGIVYTDGRPDAPIPFDYVITGAAAAFEPFHSVDENGNPYSLHLLFPDYFGPKLPDLEASSPGPVQGVRDLATRYMIKNDLPVRHQASYVKVDEQRAKRIADAYEKMKDAPNDPAVKSAYEALAKETIAQFEALQELGYTFEFIRGDDPYASPRDAILDMQNNKHLWVFPTDSGFGPENTASSDHPLLRETEYEISGKKARVNDLFRIVHDVFGHGSEGASFGPRGEENAWQAHVRMFSPEAARAMTTETRGQNSWVNYGPKGEANRANPKATTFADQKVGLLPKWVSEVGQAEDVKLHKPDAPSDGTFYHVPLDPNGKLQLTHWSTAPRDVLDPAFAGTGPLEGAERYSGQGVDGVYYGLAIGKAGGYRREATGPYRHDVTVDPKTVYPWYEDPLGLRDKAEAMQSRNHTSAQVAAEYERQIQAAGYKGYVVTYGPHGAAAKMFVPLKPDNVSGDTTFYQSQNRPQPLYKSQLAEQVSMAKQETASAKDWSSILPKMPGVKAAELAWTGVDSWLASMDPKQQVTRDALYEFITAQGAEVRVVKNGEFPSTRETKFDRYTVEGGTNYREWLFQVPNLDALPLNTTGEKFTYPSHWGNEENIVVHMRTADHPTPEGGKALFVEEVQSDLNNEIRKNGVDTDPLERVNAAARSNQGEVAALRKADTETKAALAAADAKRVSARRRLDSVQDTFDYMFSDSLNGYLSKTAPETVGTPARIRLLSILRDIKDTLRPILGNAPLEKTAAFIETSARDLLAKDPGALAVLDKLPPGLFAPEDKADLAFTLEQLNVARGAHDAALSEYRSAGVTRAMAHSRLQTAVENNPPLHPLNPFAEASAIQLAMKQALREAAQGGYDRLSWTPGAMQAERWGAEVRQAGAPIPLREMTVVSAFDDAGAAMMRFSEGGEAFVVLGHDGLFRVQNTVGVHNDLVSGLQDSFAGKTPEEVFSPEGAVAFRAALADAVAKDAPVQVAGQSLNIPGLPAKGQGYANVYDRQVKSFVEAFAKKNGSKVDVSTVDGKEVWSVPITPAMREAALKPFSLFQPGDGAPRGSIILPPSGTGAPTIQLFERADLSTVLHEGGHWFLHVLQDMAQKGDTSAAEEMGHLTKWWMDNADAVAKDAGVGVPVVRKFLKNGTTGDSDLDAKVNVGLHEQFARGLEAYYMEGKAPSNVLRAAFESFTAWMLSIYKHAKNLNVNLNDEVRGVFDRLLATDDEIAKAAGNMGIADNEIAATAKEMGLDPATYQTLVELSHQAHDEARQAMLKEVMAPIRAMRSEEQAAERNAIREQVTKEVMAQPHNRVVQWLANGKWVGEGDAPVEASEHDLRLDRALTIQEYGEPAVRALPRGRREMVVKGSGVTADDIAGLFGYRTGADLMHDVTTAPRAADEIKARVESAMRDKYGDTLVDGKVEQQAVDALHGEKRGQLIVAELRAMNKIGAKGKMTTRAQAAYIAKTLIDKMPARKAKAVGVFLGAERRHAEEALRAMAAGKLDEAFAAKRKQLIAHSLYVRGKEAAETVGKLENLAARLRTLSTRKKLAGTYLAAIDEVLNTYSFTKISGVAEQRGLALNAYINMMVAAGRENELAIPAHVASQAARVPYLSLPMDRLTGVYDTLRNIEHTARFVQKLRDRQSDRDQAVVVAGIKGAFDANVHGNLPSRRPGTKEKVLDGVHDYVNLVTNADTILRRIDGWSDRGPAILGLKESIDDASAWELVQREKAAHDIESLYNVYAKSEQRAMGRPRVIDGVPEAMSKWDVISVALNTGNADNYDRLTSIDSPLSYTRAQVDAMLTTMDARDWSFVQSIWDYINTWWEPISQRENRTTGLRPTKVDAAMQVDAPGHVSGGYYPIVYDNRFSTKSANEQVEEIFTNMRAGMFGKAQTKNGHLKERAQGSGGRTLKIGMGVFHRHISNVIHDLAFSEPINNAWRVLHDPVVDDLFRKNGMTTDFKSLEFWLQDTASGAISSGDFLSRAMTHMKNGFTLSKLAFNLHTAMMHVIGLSQSVALLGAEDMARGIFAYSKDPAGNVARVMARSPFMQERQISAQKDIYDLSRLSGSDLGATQGHFGEFTTFMATVGDLVRKKAQFYAADMPTWIAGYERSIRAGMSDEEAGKNADRLVARAQSSGFFSDRTPLERGTTSQTSRQSAVVKLLTTLASYMLAKFNVAQEIAGRTSAGVTGANAPSALAVIKGAADMSLLFLVDGVLAAAVHGQLPGQPDSQNKGESWAKFVAKETLLTVMATMPGFRELAGISQGFSGSTYDSVLTSVWRSVNIHLPPNKTDVKHIVDSFGLAIPGVPSSMINHFIEAEYQRQHGKSVTPFDYVLGMKPMKPQR